MTKDFAVIMTGGKQYRVSAGDKVKIEKLTSGAAPKVPVESGKSVSFDAVLLRSIGDKVSVGAPHVAGAVVEAKLLKQDKERTKIVFKYHAKARYRKKKGHRQEYTEVQIVKI